MRYYSITYLDIQGKTQKSDFLPFEDNKAAIEFARIGLVRNAIVEVWKDKDLVTRFYRDLPPEKAASATAAQNAERAFHRADRKEKLESLDNEGGAVHRPAAAHP